MLRPISALLIFLVAGSMKAQSAPQISDETSWGFQVASEDHTVSSGDDFFLYAEGSYVKNLTIPPDRTSIGLLSDIDARLEEQIRDLLEAEVQHTGSSPAEQKAGDFYRAYMDTDRIETLDIAPLKPVLAQVRAVKSRTEMTRVMGALAFSFGTSVIDTDTIPDSGDTTHYLLELRQSGFGLPGREYYIDSRFASVKKSYTDYVSHMLQLVKWPEAEREAPLIVAFETRLAGATWTDEQERDAQKTYNPTNMRTAQSSLPGFDLRSFIQAAGYGMPDRLSLREASALPETVNLYQAEDLETLKAWEAFHIVDQASGLLPRRFAQARFDFHGHTLEGQVTPSPRWRLAVDESNRRLGEAIGQIYVARYFTPEAKNQMEQLVANLMAAFHERIEHSNWMSTATRQEALNKLSSMSVGVGYPSRWKTYSFVVSPTDLVGDVERSIAWSQQQRALRLGKPVDREAWELLPQSLASEYNPLINRMTFPAANLEFPFFDPHADPAINYGAIGVVIGHELTHGFDDEGRRYDSKGLLRDWWTETDARNFRQQADRLAQQYATFEPLPGMHVNGPLTLGEDLADTGGIAISLDAYHRFLAGAPAPVLDGTTGDQRFFLGAAQVWAGKSREEAIRRQLTNNNHPPGKERVNGEVRNLDAWYTAFGVRPGEKLYLPTADRVHIW